MMAGFNVPMYNPTPIQSPQNALMQGLEVQRARQGNVLQQLQLQAYAQKQQEAQAQAAQEAQLLRDMPSPRTIAAGNALQGGGGPTMANAQRMAPVDPRLEMLHRLMQARQVSPVDYVNAAMPAPKQTKIKDYKAIRNADGTVSYVGLTEDGKVVQTGQQPFEKQEVRDFGGYLGGIDPITGKVAKLGEKTMSAAERDSSARGWASERRQSAEAALPTYDATTGTWIDRKTRTVTPAVGPDGKPMGSKKPATVEERNAAGYSSRMVEATKLLDQFESEGRPTYGTNLAGGLPMVGNAARTAAMSPVQQQYRQAQEDWVRAKLRKESGAAIGADEMDREIMAYFPQPGESVGVVEQKRRARLVANEAMQRASGVAAYASDVPATLQPRVTTPANPNASAMQLFDAADAIINGGK